MNLLCSRSWATSKGFLIQDRLSSLFFLAAVLTKFAYLRLGSTRLPLANSSWSKDATHPWLARGRLRLTHFDLGVLGGTFMKAPYLHIRLALMILVSALILF